MSNEPDILRVQIDPAASRAHGKHLFMCRHQSGRDRPIEEVTASHDLDIMWQERFGVLWLTYFVNRDSRTTFCFAEAPSKEALAACHLSAHGQMPAYEVIQVEWEMVRAFLGDIAEPGLGQNWESTPFRTLLFVEVANATDAAMRLGDIAYLSLFQATMNRVEEAVKASHGRVVRRDGDGLLASFSSASSAVASALAAHRMVTGGSVLPVRTGLNAGEPVTGHRDLFGAAVAIARAAAKSAAPGSIRVTGVVHDLCAGRGFRFIPRGTLSEVGDNEVRLYELEPSTEDHFPPISRFPDRLTRREVEVLRLIAQGRSNQHIADELTISANTVARHVANILDKTNSANRTEAAAYAYRESLL